MCFEGRLFVCMFACYLPVMLEDAVWWLKEW